MPRGMFVSAGSLFHLAKAACERTLQAPSETSPGQKDALVAVIFSTVALEAFINESVEWAELSLSTSGEQELGFVNNFATILKEVEKSRGSIQQKFMLARLVLSGQVYDKGAQLYQDFDCLIELRNALAHLRPLDKFEDALDGTTPVTSPKIIRSLESKHILADFRAPVGASWTERISTRAVARWACNTASSMVQSVLEIIPQTDRVSTFKSGMDSFYGNAFKPIENSG